MKADKTKIAIALICILVLAGIGVFIYFACKNNSYQPSAIGRVGSSQKKSLLEQLMEDLAANNINKGIAGHYSDQYVSQTKYNYGTQSSSDEAAVQSVIDNLAPTD